MTRDDLIGLYITGIERQSGHLGLRLSCKPIRHHVLNHKVAIRTGNFNYMQLCGTSIVDVRENEQELRIYLSDSTVIDERKLEPFEVVVNGGDPTPFFRSLPELLRGRTITKVWIREEPPSLNLISAPDLDIGFFDLPYKVFPEGASALELEGREIVEFSIDQRANDIVVTLTSGFTLAVDSSSLDECPEGFEINLNPEGQKRLLFVGR